MIDPSSLNRIFRQMGWERVSRGARAFVQKGGWDRCFVALACGEANELRVKASSHIQEVAAEILHIEESDVRALVAHYDNRFVVFHHETEKWLTEHDPYKLVVLMAEGSVPPRKLDQAERFLQAVETGEPIPELVPELVSG